MFVRRKSFPTIFITISGVLIFFTKETVDQVQPRIKDVLHMQAHCQFADVSHMCPGDTTSITVSMHFLVTAIYNENYNLCQIVCYFCYVDHSLAGTGIEPSIYFSNQAGFIRWTPRGRSKRKDMHSSNGSLNNITESGRKKKDLALKGENIVCQINPFML